MPELFCSPRVKAGFRRTVAPVVGTLAGSLVLAGTAGAATSAPTVAPGFTITKLAPAPEGATNCDDLAQLDGHLFMTCQNKTQSPGGGGNSTIVEYADNGAVINTWSVGDKADGIGADPANHRLIITLNEDGHTHLMTITPSSPARQQVVPYKYSVDPASPSGTGSLHTGGGTDSVSVDSRGRIYVTASYGIAKSGTAVFKVGLAPPARPSGTGTATLSPTFLDNATATKAISGGGTAQLKLIDADSNAIVPYTSPRFAGQFVIDDQTALQLVFASNIDAGTGLTVLTTPYGLDDIRWTTADGGTLYVVDKGAAPNGISALYRVTGPFASGTAYASNDSIPDQVVSVNLTNGKLTPFIRHLQTAKGLVYVDTTGNAPALPLGQSSGAAAVNGPLVATPAASVAGKTSDGDALPIVLAIVALVLAALGGVLGLRRRAA